MVSVGPVEPSRTRRKTWPDTGRHWLRDARTGAYRGSWSVSGRMGKLQCPHSPGADSAPVPVSGRCGDPTGHGPPNRLRYRS